MDFFNVNTIFISVLGYNMSYLEFFGTVFNILAVWFAVRSNILTWASTLAAVTLFFFLFYQYQLYSDMVLQIFYFGTGVAGLWLWSKRKKSTVITAKPITRSTMQQNLMVVGAVLLGTVAWGTLMANIHTLLPDLFPKPAAYPYVDASIAIMAVVAQVQLLLRKFENWMLWIFMDVIAIGVYFSRGIKLVALLYVVFLTLSILGLIDWRKEMARTKDKAEEPALKPKVAS